MFVGWHKFPVVARNPSALIGWRLRLAMRVSDGRGIVRACLRWALWSVRVFPELYSSAK